MPPAQQASLDPYMALIVGYRKSGLSLNHIIGCPLDCGYCVRHFWDNFEVKTREAAGAGFNGRERRTTPPAATGILAGPCPDTPVPGRWLYARFRNSVLSGHSAEPGHCAITRHWLRLIVARRRR
jgi:hypothetical protein